MDNLSLAELSERSGVSPRTIRFYIAQGVMPGPLKSGRGAVYDHSHLERLGRIRELQDQGMTLSEVALALSPDEESYEMAEPVSSWLEYRIADDLVVLVRGGTAPWRHKMIRKTLAEAAAKLRNKSGEKDPE